MLDIGWSEMAVIALIALVVIGPKDLPRVLRTVGQWTRKARGLAREFQSGLDDMIRDAELDEARKTIERTRKLDLGKEVEKTVDPEGEISREAKSLEAAGRISASDTKPASASAGSTKPTPSASAQLPQDSAGATTASDQRASKPNGKASQPVSESAPSKTEASPAGEGPGTAPGTADAAPAKRS